jgi:hypothetical protein
MGRHSEKNILHVQSMIMQASSFPSGVKVGWKCYPLLLQNAQGSKSNFLLIQVKMFVDLSGHIVTCNMCVYCPLPLVIHQNSVLITTKYLLRVHSTASSR